MATLTVERDGRISLPGSVRDRYGIEPDTPVRIVETESGILLVPLTREPMSAELARELEEWQTASLATWDLFPYEESAA